MPNSRKEWAYTYVDAGLYVFELQEGSKEPVGGVGWLAGAVNSRAGVDRIFNASPYANYGVCPGPGMVWVDLDISETKDGTKALWALEMNNDDLPKTFKAKTPSGGVHLLFRTSRPVSNSSANFPAGIDIRGGHGYIVGVGSELLEGYCKDTDTPGTYEVLEGSLDAVAEAPEWLMGMLKSPGADDPNHDIPLCEYDQPQNVWLAEEFLIEREAAEAGNNGDDWTWLTAAFLRDFGISEEKALELMNSTGWNNRCTPPWENGELEVKIKNGYRHGENRPGCKRDRTHELRSSRGPRMSAAQINEKFHMSPLERKKSELHRAAEERQQQDQSTSSDTLPRGFYTDFSFMARGRRREYIIPGWLPAHGMTALLATRGVGKSTVLIDMACRLAHNMSWHRLPTMAEERYEQDWKVVYLCGEDDEGLELNITGWHKYYNRKPSGRLFIRDGITHLMDEADVEKEINVIKELVGDSRVILILDTWQRATSDGRQNADDEMNRAINSVEFMAKYFDGPVIIASHPPKDGRQTILGSSAIENATSAIWVLEEEGDGVRLKVTRIKGPGHGNWQKFKFEQIDLDSQDVFGNKEVGLLPTFVGGIGINESPQEQRMSVEKRMALALAVRGCYEFPRDPTNTFEPLTSLSCSNVVNFIAEMHHTKHENDHAAEFCRLYLHDLYASGTNNIVGYKGSKWGDQRRNGSTYQLFYREFLDKEADTAPVDFKDEEGTRLAISGNRSFLISDERSRAAKRARKITEGNDNG